MKDIDLVMVMKFNPLFLIFQGTMMDDLKAKATSLDLVSNRGVLVYMTIWEVC